MPGEFRCGAPLYSSPVRQITEIVATDRSCRSYSFSHSHEKLHEKLHEKRSHRNSCLDRQPSPVSSPADRTTPTRQPPHARTVTLLSPRTASTTSSAPPLHLTFAPPLFHFSATALCTPRQACVRKHTHKREQTRRVSLRVLLSVFAWICGR